MASSSSCHLEQLPLEVLESICDHLLVCDDTRRSLDAFSLTSKRCCAASDKQRFESIRFRLRNAARLRQDVERWDETLGSGRLRHVRQVRLVGLLLPADLSDIGINHGGFPVKLLGSRLSKGEYDCPSHDADGFWKPTSSTPRLHHFECLREGEAKQRWIEAWMPLLQFLAQLPALKDLIYACPEQVPLCILSMLHDRHPNCRLHVTMFDLRSLHQQNGHPHDIHPDEFELVTSPCLYSITLSHSPCDSPEIMNYNGEAVLQMVAGLAPRLRCVDMQRWTMDPRRAPTRHPWPGFFVDSSRLEAACHIKAEGKGQIESLVLQTYDDPSPSQTIAQWENLTDFSKLRRLELAPVHLETLRILTRIADNGGLQCLRTLSFIMRRQLDFDGTVSALLLALHPLEALGVSGLVNVDAFEAIIDHHGKALRCLRLQDVHLTEGHILGLGQRCSNLRKVYLKIFRTSGDAGEVRIYRALGTLPRLEHASLILDSTPLTPTANDGRKWAREVLINSALDSSLARSIFRLVSTRSTGPYPTLHPSLRSLELQPCPPTPEQCHSKLPHVHILDMVRWVGRSWVCTRDGLDLSVRDTTGLNDYDLRELGYMAEEVDPRFGIAGEVWTEIWPRRTADWKDDWSSFPLQEDESSDVEETPV